MTTTDGDAGRRLPLSAYAVLGLLSQGPSSGYGIAGALTRGFAGNLFVRGATKAYEEPRRLVARGLATAERVWQGRRPRTVYALTDDGRAVLAQWLQSGSAPPVLEVESLLKVFFGDADGADPVRSVDEVAQWASDRFAEGAEVLASYRQGRGTYQHNARWVRLTMLANIELTDAFARWSRRAAAELACGSEVVGFDDLADDLAARAARHAAAGADDPR